MLMGFAFQYICATISCFSIFPDVKIHSESGQGTSTNRSGRSRPFESEVENKILGFNFDTSTPPLVYTETGWLEGYFQKTILDRSVAAFDGIPYGRAPTGQRRFKKPEPFPPWPGIRKAVSKPPPCLQLNYGQLLRLHGEENCLYINIYTPMLPDVGAIGAGKDPKLPVIFFIHGGGYMSGTSSDTGPAYLLNEDVILVTINYRLGVLGFLSTGDDSASGNWALKDQLLALKWVSKNIKYFGGDPNRITLMGVSAGAASVGLHLVSKQSEGLFHRAICESGSSLTHWAVQNDTVENSRKVASFVGCPTSSSKSMISCLRRVDPNWIVGRSFDTWKIPLLSRLPFGAVIEQPGPNSFLNEAPEVTYLNGGVNPVPLIIGFNQDEGSIFAVSMYMTPMLLNKINRDWGTHLPYALAFDKRTQDPDGKAAEIRNVYLNGEGMNFQNRRAWSDMLGDRTIVQGTYSGMQYHSAVGPTYGYYFNYEGPSIVNGMGLRTADWGVSHADEMIYLFNSTTNYGPLEYGTVDYKISQFMVNLWANFAKTGVPFYTDESGNRIDLWNTIQKEGDMEVLRINREPRMIPVPLRILDRIAFWQSLRLKDDHAYPTTFTDR